MADYASAQAASRYGVQPGPCVVCGARNYPLSMGGPHICPACDCGIPLSDVRHPQHPRHLTDQPSPKPCDHVFATFSPVPGQDYTVSRCVKCGWIPDSMSAQGHSNVFESDVRLSLATLLQALSRIESRAELANKQLGELVRTASTLVEAAKVILAATKPAGPSPEGQSNPGVSFP